ncbi:MAG TPA: ABC transporter ATP-binding protein [Gemmatimonadales bacterium]|nr:ABC transporter ATP-binding protein [Gemmatimonadales bacterium]HZH42425.1 ABC transporter ATP-binding protein [Gemmatimonadales bacterium]
MIIFERAARRYGSRLALEALTLRVAPGEVVALVGPNGAGKSTTLRIAAGLVRPTEGRATIAGFDVQRDPAQARRRMGYLPQKLGVPLSTGLADLARLVASARGLRPAAGSAALAAAGLADRADASLAELSGGQRQRAMLALATLGDVAALLLDEPTISLDSDGAEEVRAAIALASGRGAAVLFASHHLHDVAVLADRVVVMVEGRVAAAGTLPELAASVGVSWTADAEDPPIERVYRRLVRGRVALVRGDAA